LRQATSKAKVRKSSFRPEVLSAYSQKCAVCGYGSNLGMNSVGLDAAHIQWHGYGGPDEVQNGIALCSLHHRLFDRGAFTITSEFMIQFSSLFNGSGALNAGFQFHGKQMSLPFHEGFLPNGSYLRWHHKEVFRGEVATQFS
jgi:putative restriction endonuclease